MLVRHHTDLPWSAERTEAALLRSPADWLPCLARRMDDQGRRLLAEVGVGRGGRRLTREVRVEIGTPLRLPSKLVLPIRWAAASAPGLFPTLDADIEVAPLGADCTRLSISASYRPPLGLPGRALDRVLLHRVGEAVVADFLDDVARLLGRGDGMAARRDAGA
jgi:hypothetical protein